MSISLNHISTKTSTDVGTVIPADSEENLVKKTYLKSKNQVFSTVILCLGCLSMGNVFGWSVGSPAQIERDSIPARKSLLKSLFTLGAFLSGPLTAYIMRRYGRKWPMFCFGIVACTGWATIVSAKWIGATQKDTAAYILYVARFICGVGTAGCFNIAPVYVKETTDDAHRGVLSSIVNLSTIFGNFLAVCLSVQIPWEWCTLTLLCIPMVLVIVGFFIPESPVFLITKEKHQEAQDSFNWFWGGYSPEEKQVMFKKFRRVVDVTNQSVAMNESAKQLREERKQLKFTSRPVLRPAILSVILLVFQQMCGCNVLTTYTIGILEQGGGGDLIKSTTGSIIVAGFFILFVTIATFTVDKFGRKPMMLGSVASQTLIHCGLATYLILADKDNNILSPETVRNVAWIPLVCLILIIASYAMGMGSVAWLVAAEINHPDYMEISSTMVTSTYWLGGFATIQSFGATEGKIPMSVWFFVYGGSCFIAIFFIYFSFFETKGLTQEEIMMRYRNPSYKKDLEQSLTSMKTKDSKASERFFPNRM